MTAKQEEGESRSGAPDVESGPLSAVRRRGAFLIGAVLWAAAAGGTVVLGGYFVIVFNLGIDAGERLRQVLGLEAPATGPDWYLAAVVLLMILVPVGLAAGLWLWYRGVWRRRLQEVWTQGSDQRRFSKLRSLPLRADAKRQREHGEYVSGLLASPAWLGAIASTGGGTMGGSPEIEESTATDYRPLAERVLQEIEDDVAERAIATGLIVALGPSKLDRLTIVVAALEMQLHVLTRLGKKPSAGTWMELLKRTNASLFFNTYLSREDTLLVAFSIRRMAMGLEMAAELSQDAAEALSEGGGDDDFDEAWEDLNSIPGLGGFLRTAGSMSFGIGAFGLQQTADMTREVGEELLQGALAGGVLYYHGMAIAADALALDQAHRHSQEMTRTPRQGAMRTATVAGRLLRDQVKRYRGAYRERRRAPLRMAARYMPRWQRGQNEPAAAPENGPSGTGAQSPEGKRRGLLAPPWRLRRERRTLDAGEG